MIRLQGPRRRFANVGAAAAVLARVMTARHRLRTGNRNLRTDLAMTLAFVALGANLGPVQETLHWAVQELGALPTCQGMRCSSFYRSAPVQAQGPDYVNAVVSFETQLSAQTLLQALQAIEKRAGRVRSYRNASRPLDLDLLLFGQERIAQADLEVPHPRMFERAFVLLPLAELDSNLVNAEQLRAVADQVIERL